jgi:hypothetical protein
MKNSRRWLNAISVTSRHNLYEHSGTWRTRPLVRLSAVLMLSVFVLTSQVKAEPIKYTEQILVLGCNGATTGALGNVSFGDVFIMFSFQGDTSNVIPFSVPGSNGYENLLGTATVTVTDLNLVPLAVGTFLPSAGIFVSVDNSNAGIGLGSFGVLPTNSSFPGQPVYPAGFNASVPSYDLKSDFYVTGHAISCVGFPGSCGSAIPLPTTAGDFYLNPGSGGQCPVNIANCNARKEGSCLFVSGNPSWSPDCRISLRHTLCWNA